MTVKSFFLLIFGLVTPVCAQLKWERPEQTLVPRLGEKTATAKYRFTNVSSSPIAILKVQPSCGCTTATLAKKAYAPGESGEIDATFNFAGHVGHQEKWISVTTDIEDSDPTILSLVVDIPPDVTIRPEFVMWRIGDPIAPKNNARVDTRRSSH